MGLDIRAYQEIRPVREDDGNDNHSLEKFYRNPDFPDQFDDLKEGLLYAFQAEYKFPAGSYGGYNDWRECLAKMAGYPLTERVNPREGREPKCHAAACWRGAKGPFSELINFADNEGAIGPKTAAKLAKDFVAFDERAEAIGGWFYDRYKHWRKAMEMAADNGAVAFH